MTDSGARRGDRETLEELCRWLRNGGAYREHPDGSEGVLVAAAALDRLLGARRGAQVEYEAQVQRDGVWWRLAGHSDVDRLRIIAASAEDWLRLPHRIIRITTERHAEVME